MSIIDYAILAQVKKMGNGGGGGGGEVSAIIKPLTITKNGTYNAVEGGMLKYDTEVQFKKDITVEDFQAYVANATSTGTMQGMELYSISGDWTVANMGGVVWMIANSVGGGNIPSYYIGGASMGMPDGWQLGDGTMVDTPPAVSIPEGAVMSADLATTAVFFNLEQIDGYAPITVKSKELSTMISVTGMDDSDYRSTDIYDDSVTNVRDYAFYRVGGAKSITLPNATQIGGRSFSYCTAPKITLPKVTEAGGEYHFEHGSSIEIEMPLLENVPTGMFYGCMALATVKLLSATSIADGGFRDCYSLKTLILGAPTVCTASVMTAINNWYHMTGTVHGTYNPNGLQDGYIYVPSALIEDYKVAQYWSTYADRFRAIEDYPEICEF